MLAKRGMNSLKDFAEEIADLLVAAGDIRIILGGKSAPLPDDFKEKAFDFAYRTKKFGLIG